MRIVQVSDCYLPRMGGIETQVSLLSEQLAKQGHDVTVLTATAPTEQRGMASPWESSQSRRAWVNDALLEVAADSTPLEPPVRVVRSIWANPLGLPVDPRAGKRFAALIRDLNPDVVNFHMGELTPVVMATVAELRRSQVPTVVSIHSVWSGGLTVATYAAAVRALGLDKEPIIWAPVSELVARNVRRVVGPAGIRIQGNGVNQEQWRAEPLPHRGLRAVTATRFAPRKRVPELLEVLRHVGEALGLNAPGGAFANPTADLEVVLAGEGPGLESARRFLLQHGMDSWVKTPGRLHQSELRDLYRGSDVFLAPGIKDSFSIAGREGLVAGLAVLTRSQSGLGADLESGVEGRAVTTDEQMANVLIQWAREPDLIADIKKHNLDTDYRYSWEHVIPRTIEMYEEARRLVLP